MNMQTGRPRPNDQDFERRRLNSIRTSLIIGGLFLFVALISIPLSLQTPNNGGAFISIGIVFVLSIVGFISAWLSYRSQVIRASYLLIGAIILLAQVLPFVTAGQAIAQAVILLVVVTAISASSLKDQEITIGIVAGIVGSISLIILDQVVPDYASASNSGYTNIFAGIILVVFIALLARQFRSFPLRVKLVLGFLAATIFPLAIYGYINYTTTTDILLSESRTQLADLSKHAASSVDSYIDSQLNDIQAESKQVALVDYIESDARKDSAEEFSASITLLNDKRKDPVFVRSLAILDINGKNILDTEKGNQGKDESGTDYFKQPLISAQPYFSNLVFQDGGASIFFSAPIKNTQGNIIGVLREEVDARVLQTIVRALVEENPGILVALIDRETYVRVAFTGDRTDLYKSYKNFSDAELGTLQQQKRVRPGSPRDAISANDSAFIEGINSIDFQPSFEAFSTSLNDNAINVGSPLRNGPWVAIAEESLTSHLAPITQQSNRGILIAILLVGGSVIIGLLATNIVTAPITSLSRVAERISGGDLNIKASVETRDEIGILAQTMNRMTDELSQTLESLEKRVTERTLDLEQARLQSEKRSRELQAIGEISNIINSEQRTENLLPLITRLVSERFDFYHVGIFLLDETRQFAHLKAANSPGGQRMLARGHRLEVGATGIVGNVTFTGKPRIALDVGADSVFFNNPDLPDTRSEMALPLTVRNVLIGALDVQSDQPNAFSEGDVKVLSILSDQVATAIENARLFERTQEALNEVQNVYGQFLKEQWSLFAQQEEQVGYYQKVTGGKKLTSAVDSQEIQQVMNQGRTVILENNNGHSTQPQIIIPIKLRGQVIGVVNVAASKNNYKWNQDEINLTEAVSERLALALENARLLDESQTRAAKEKVISEVTSKIGASINMQSVLQTAVEELGRALPGSEVVIHLESPEENQENE